jgi:exosome complex RNA-binding protein Rrp4
MPFTEAKHWTLGMKNLVLVQPLLKSIKVMVFVGLNGYIHD